MRRVMVVLLMASVIPFGAPGPTRALPRGLDVSTYKRGLNFPVDMAWVPGSKRIFFTEKTGKIRVMDGDNIRSRACRTLDVNSDGERGLLGIVLHPNFERNHWLYVYYSNASPLESRVTRFTVKNGRCRNQITSSRESARPRPAITMVASSNSWEGSSSFQRERSTTPRWRSESATSWERSSATTPTGPFPRGTRSIGRGTRTRSGPTAIAIRSG